MRFLRELHRDASPLPFPHRANGAPASAIAPAKQVLDVSFPSSARQPDHWPASIRLAARTALVLFSTCNFCKIAEKHGPFTVASDTPSS